MGLLQDGVWSDQWYDTESTGGVFVRAEAQFRNWVTPDGEAGPTGGKGFRAEPNRYHLYVSLACPWAHRALIFRVLKGLEDTISISVVNWLMAENGWTFVKGDDLVNDNIYGFKFLYQIYTRAKSNYSGRVTVPVLWDMKRKTIVSNESSEIIRMFNSAFNDCGANSYDYYPKRYRSEINELNRRIYDTLNNGVYRCGFASTQDAYEEALVPLFETLDWLEDRLKSKKYLVGDQITEADWRLFTTLVRFDAVYVGHFKCNIRRISDYKNISAYLSRLYSIPGINRTVNIDHIKGHYYGSHRSINPSKVVPKGPILEFLSEGQ